MNNKERFRATIETLRNATKALPVEQRSPAINAADTVERFAGELRRQSSVLKREIETTRNDLAEMKGRVNQGASELAKHDQRAEEQRRKFEQSLRDAFRPGNLPPVGGENRSEIRRHQGEMPGVLAPFPDYHLASRAPHQPGPALSRMRSARRSVPRLEGRGPGVHLRACPRGQPVHRASVRDERDRQEPCGSILTDPQGF